MNNYPDARQYAPATERNREPILEVLQAVLPPNGTILEVASGTGQHAVYFAPRLAPRKWLPSDTNPVALASIAAWRQYCPCENLYAPIDLDVCAPSWHIETNIVAIASINMIHIAPWAACLGLIAGAKRLLPPGGILYLYGPFKQGGEHTAPSNAAFDASLRAQNPHWGIRNLEEVVAVAQAENFLLLKTIAMPANNYSVVWQKNT
ncbi:DUF938 domain-containing protein [Aliterella atlantica]|uniref:SAM-dependent methyltransferase n=1 Tax=Aliterella atlantica CENA595 TaxID=1618023 RepID=A0A0D8ZVX7_9CYAN|nr:DUF938 domain-containing protein [Aliterella atlantica]KJH71376.1 SAM-dependent methyltransferase [Aliterella atlantica CENA595]